jgi:hypothetical protein
MYVNLCGCLHMCLRWCCFHASDVAGLLHVLVFLDECMYVLEVLSDNSYICTFGHSALLIHLTIQHWSHQRLHPNMEYDKAYMCLHIILCCHMCMCKLHELHMDVSLKVHECACTCVRAHTHSTYSIFYIDANVHVINAHASVHMYLHATCIFMRIITCTKAHASTQSKALHLAQHV